MTHANCLYVERRTAALLKRLGQVGPFVRASLVYMPHRCGNTRGHCAKGEKPPSWRLTYKDKKQKTVAVYVPVDMVQEVGRWVKNYRAFKQLAGKISAAQLAHGPGPLGRQRVCGKPPSGGCRTKPLKTANCLPPHGLSPSSKRPSAASPSARSSTAATAMRPGLPCARPTASSSASPSRKAPCRVSGRSFKPCACAPRSTGALAAFPRTSDSHPVGQFLVTPALPVAIPPRARTQQNLSSRYPPRCSKKTFPAVPSHATSCAHRPPPSSDSSRLGMRLQ